MSSTHVSSGAANRGLNDTVSGLMKDLSKHSRVIIGLVAGLAAIGAASAVFMSKKETRVDAGRDALFKATQQVDKELTALASTYPAQDAPSDPMSALSGAKNKADSKAKAPAKIPASVESIAYEAFDVDAKVPEGVKQLKEVAAKYPGTKPGHLAELALGDLYFNHGEPTEAIQWYKAAVDSSSNSNEKALALYNLGYAYENAGQIKEATQSYEKAVGLGAASLKGELLLSLGRGYKLDQNKEKARSTYDLIISQMPNTEFARGAEQEKLRLE